MSDRLIDVAEAARLLTLAEGTVRNMAEAGRLPVVRPAGTRRVRFRLSDIVRLAGLDGASAEPLQAAG